MSDDVPQRYRVAITADNALSDGLTIFGDIGLDRLSARGIDWAVLPEYTDPPAVAQLRDFDAVLSLGHIHFGAETLAALPRVRHIARFGAGYETIDLDACSAAGVAVTNTPDGVRRPLALAALTLVLSLAHNVAAKDHITRTGTWDQRPKFRGHGVDGKVLGVLGFGSVGGDLAQLAQGVGFTVIGNNRSGHSARAAELGVELLELDALLQRSDYVVVTASLNSENYGLLDARRLALLKPTAYVINVARGGLIDQDALTAVLREHRIAGAALDVFTQEPPHPDDALLGLDNVILTPHSLPWTEEFTRDVSASALGAIIDVAEGRRPQFLLNPDAFNASAWTARRTEMHDVSVPGV